jgi:cytochrome b561
MSAASNRAGISAYLVRTGRRRPLPPRPVQGPGAANEPGPSVAPAPRATGYSVVMQATHWVSVALCLLAFLIAWRIGNAADDEAPWLVMLHRSLSVTILTLIGLRLAWRWCAQFRRSGAKASSVLQMEARASVILLYFLLAAQPLMDLAASMLEGNRIVVFGVIEVHSFLAVNEALSRQVLRVHGLTAALLLALIGLHVTAALRSCFLGPGALFAFSSSGRNPSRSIKSDI